jgi:hypothetical protein
VLKDPMLRRPGGAEAVLVLPVVAIERNIPVLYGTGGVLNDTRTISNRTCDFVVDPPADNDSMATVARGMLAGCCSNGMVLIILVGDLIAHNHGGSARGYTRWKHERWRDHQGRVRHWRRQRVQGGKHL